jgi:hypothetical protein
MLVGGSANIDPCNYIFGGFTKEKLFQKKKPALLMKFRALCLIVSGDYIEHVPLRSHEHTRSSLRCPSAERHPY